VRKTIRAVAVALSCISLAAFLTTGIAYAQAIPVNPTYKGLFASSDPTMTFLFESPQANATLVFIPGGEGRRGVKPEWTASHGYFSSYHFNVMLRSLSDHTVTSGQFNIVIFDSPMDLPTANHWSAARQSTDHLSRVEDVVRHYKEKFGKLVWLMGHSMGSISITEIYKRLQDKKAESLVAGLILSGGENGTSFNYETTRLPVLVLHHENDECVGNTPGHAKKVFARLREAGNTAAELVLINSGTRSPDNNNPCRSGYHMYYGAVPDVAKVLDQFMSKHLGSR
jgi:pimeloyl-ACP methyl ester carboxylesterase